MINQENQSLIECFRGLLSKGMARTQEDLKIALQKQGFEVNQSKISRLLRKIGAVKSLGVEGQISYQMPLEPEPPAKGSLVDNLVLDIVYNEMMIVIRTSPGSASLIARVIDHNTEKLNTLGTVAGDDTIFIVPQSIKTIEKTVQVLKSLLFN
jgi:transcriptional regulator of arginine metabolism